MSLTTKNEIIVSAVIFLCITTFLKKIKLNRIEKLEIIDKAINNKKIRKFVRGSIF